MYAPTLEDRVAILEKTVSRLVGDREIPASGGRWWSRPDIRVLDEHTVRLDDIEAKVDFRFDDVDRRLDGIDTVVREILSRMGEN